MADYTKYCKKVAALGFDVLEVATAGLLKMSDDLLDELVSTAKQLKGTSKNSMHEPLSTVNGSFFCKKPRNRGTMPTFFAKKSLAHSDKSSHL